MITKGLTCLAVSATVWAGGFLSPFTAHAHAAAASMDVKVQVNDKLVQFPDAQPFLDDNHATQVPIRFVTEKLGYDVQWQKEGDQIKVTLNNDKHSITLVSGQKEAEIDNNRVEMDTHAEFQNGRVYVPLRFLSNASDIPVKWDASSKLAILSKDGNNYAPDYELFESTAYSSDPSENGGYGAVDYMGNPLRIGTVAVDPTVIPLGSKLYIEGYNFNGLPAGGMYAYATDTGGSIKGKRVDIYVPGSNQSLRSFGFQTVKVYVLNP
ncbi:stalk domain-containing protein [Paenibacillus sp. GCM10023248]|uniref:stalk domain-containing protein n=1 Tax=Bacillales TaxID=1385 RepID=UPI0023793C9F|nr:MULTISPECIES: stalk domain-containing protein [Bacillales]MDD9271163.1 stalk domain-containing protein [Paenibacillus sp. MAHUQ-63]